MEVRRRDGSGWSLKELDTELDEESERTELSGRNIGEVRRESVLDDEYADRGETPGSKIESYWLEGSSNDWTGTKEEPVRDSMTRIWVSSSLIFSC